MSKTAVLLGFLLLLGVTSGFRFPGEFTSLGTFNAAILPQYPQMKERVELLIELVRLINWWLISGKPVHG